LKKGQKFVFNNKTFTPERHYAGYGSSPLEETVALLYFAQDILKVGPEEFGFPGLPRRWRFITMPITAYVPLNKMRE
jgi:hypothetical protein